MSNFFSLSIIVAEGLIYSILVFELLPTRVKLKVTYWLNVRAT